MLMVRRDAPGKVVKLSLHKHTIPQFQATTLTTQTILDSGNLDLKVNSTLIASTQVTTSVPSVRGKVPNVSHLSSTQMTQLRVVKS